ncbi:type II toxin-antitoxin system VapC family toxin [Candidatus Daviesbacteria bacterium]|nr:type II toxin-antitoxin system VapC family toxin [Candidatus Daviesbacteria bacterium]
MKYLIDSDILVDHIRGRKYLDVGIVEAGLSMSIINLAELFYGAYRSEDISKSLQKIDALFSLGIKVANLNSQVIEKYAQLKVSLEIKGQKLDEFDLLIAATALVNNLIIVTRNLGHFKRIKGLKIAE